MGRALIIGCGGVAGVVIHKCCQNGSPLPGGSLFLCTG